MNKIMAKNHRFCLWVVLAVIAGISLWSIGKYGLADWDEAIYADIARNVTKGHIAVLQWGDQNWFQKPPFYFWIVSIFYKIFNINEFSSRLLSALSGIGLSYLIYLFAKKMFDTKIALIALFLTLFNGFLLYSFRFGTTDIFVLFLTATATYLFWLSQDDKKYLIPSFIILGIAGLTKGPVIVSICLIFLIYIIITSQLKDYFKNKLTWISILILCAIILPWHIYMFKKFGYIFYNEYIVYQILTRAKVPIEGHSGSHLYYPKLILRNFPLVLGLFLSFFIPAKDWLKQRKEIIFLTLWLIIQYFTIDKVATKLDWYILPLFLPLQIILAYIIYTCWHKKSLILRVVICCIFVLDLGVTLFKPYGRWHEYQGQQNAKNCFLRYKGLNLSEDFVTVGYNLPAAMFYLNSNKIHQLEKMDQEFAASQLILIKDGLNIPSNFLIKEKLDSCAIIEKK